MRINETGRSMIEMLGVLAIVGVLSVGGIAGYSKAMAKYKTDKLMNQVNEIVVNIRSLYLQQKSFEGLNATVIIKSGVVPNEMLPAEHSTSKIVHIYNGSVTLYPSKTSNGKVSAFEIYINELTSPTCLALVTMDWGTDPASGFVSLYVDNESVEISSAQMEDVHLGTASTPEDGIYVMGSSEPTVPLTLPQATEACSCSGPTCVVGLKYY